MVDQRPVGLVADGGDQRDEARRRRAHDDLLVKAPEVLERAAAARDDERRRAVAAIRPSGSALKPAMAAATSAADRLALHPHRPDQHMARKAVGEAVQDVADDGAGRRGDDADHARQKRERALARLVEQALGGEPAAALLEQRHERADAGGLDRTR